MRWARGRMDRVRGNVLHTGSDDLEAVVVGVAGFEQKRLEQDCNTNLVAALRPRSPEILSGT